jgi:protein structure with unknown function
MSNDIKWPTLLIIENDDLLYFLSSTKDLSTELENHYLTHSDTCTLLDQTGQKFNLALDQKDTLTRPYSLHPSTFLDLAVFNQMVRNHLSTRQQCCALKINISSFEQGFQLILNTSED